MRKRDPRLVGKEGLPERLDAGLSKTQPRAMGAEAVPGVPFIVPGRDDRASTCTPLRDPPLDLVAGRLIDLVGMAFDVDRIAGQGLEPRRVAGLVERLVRGRWTEVRDEYDRVAQVGIAPDGFEEVGQGQAAFPRWTATGKPRTMGDDLRQLGEEAAPEVAVAGGVEDREALNRVPTGDLDPWEEHEVGGRCGFRHEREEGDVVMIGYSHAG